MNVYSQPLNAGFVGATHGRGRDGGGRGGDVSPRIAGGYRQGGGGRREGRSYTDGEIRRLPGVRTTQGLMVSDRLWTHIWASKDVSCLLTLAQGRETNAEENRSSSSDVPIGRTRNLNMAGVVAQAIVFSCH